MKAPIIRALAAVAALATASFVGTQVASASAKPLPTFFAKLEVRPATIMLGQNYFGPKADGNLYHLVWANWSYQAAHGTGSISTTWGSSLVPVKVTLSDPQPTPRFGPVFQRITLAPNFKAAGARIIAFLKSMSVSSAQVPSPAPIPAPKPSTLPYDIRLCYGVGSLVKDMGDPTAFLQVAAHYTLPSGSQIGTDGTILEYAQTMVSDAQGGYWADSATQDLYALEECSYDYPNNTNISKAYMEAEQVQVPFD